MRKFLAAFLAVAALAVSGMTNVFATETAVSVNYEFLGARAEWPGFAGGKIVVTPAENTPAEGHYLVYYTDDKGVLAGYDELATTPVTGNKVTIPVEDGLMIPMGATGIAAKISLSLSGNISSALFSISVYGIKIAFGM